MYNKFKGFTLAEVLITLGIIGVVAALTLPSLIQNYQKQVWVNQLKKTVSVLENGFKLIMTTENVDKLSDTTLWQTAMSSPCNYTTNCAEFYNIFSKYFNAGGNLTNTNSRTFSSLKDSSSVVYGTNYEIKLNSGANLTIFAFSGTPNASNPWGPHSHVAAMIIDVNGNQKPNQAGRDVFFFGVHKLGHLIPFGSKKAATIYCSETLNVPMEHVPACYQSYSSFVWDNSSNTNACSENGNGQYCAARIMENGWKMDY